MELNVQELLKQGEEFYQSIDGVNAAWWIITGVAVSACVWVIVPWRRYGKGIVQGFRSLYTGIGYGFKSVWDKVSFWRKPAPGEGKKMEHLSKKERKELERRQLATVLEDGIEDLVLTKKWTSEQASRWWQTLGKSAGLVDLLPKRYCNPPPQQALKVDLQAAREERIRKKLNGRRLPLPDAKKQPEATK